MKSTRAFKIAFVLSGILLLAGSQLLNIAPGEDRSLRDAWQAAVARGGYQFTTTVQQTTRPLPKLVNVGLGSKTDNIYIEGKADRHADSMQMKLWSEGGSAVLGSGALEIKVEDGKAYGRSAQEPWREMNDVTGLFAPGQDAFGFLNAAANVVADPQASRGYTIYRFDLDGVAFASYMRDTATAELERSGKLPQSYQLELSPHFVNMTGGGELWVDDATGLPLRQIIDVQFPPDKYEQVDARITTDFANWSRPATAGGVLGALTGALLRPAAVARVQGLLAAVLGGLIFLAVLMQYRKSRKFYGALALALIAIMVIGPTLEANRAQAFIADQKTHEASYAERQQARQRQAQWQAEQSAPPADPHQNPLGDSPASANHAPSVDATPTPLELLYEQLPAYDDGTDSDGDRLTDVDEILTHTDPANSDSDDDGLADGIEQFKLGTDPSVADSDSDGIPDGPEVVGFSYGGQQWYLNPNDPDTNQDGALDSAECSYDETSGLACPDTDGDGTPDVFDDDNDGDGVPDKLDAAIDTVVGDPVNGLDNNRFRFEIDNLTAGEPVYVDFQLRPTNPDHLWYTLNVLDWPSNDRQGQIQRVPDTTFYDQLSPEQQQAGGGDPQLQDGDLRLVPMLEIEIPFQDGHYGNLPVLPGAPPIQASTPITAWLDTQETKAFGINVRKLDDTSGALLATVPLTLVEDGQGASPVAFSGRMFYRPTTADFGPIQQARLVWMMTMLTNTCTPVPDSFQPPDVPEQQRRLVWCEDEANWQENGSTVVHVYEDPWVLTGMSVREDHGVEAAVIYEDPAFTAAQPGYTPGGFHDDNLWALSQGLDRSLMAGRGASGVDLTISEIAARWDKAQNGGASDTTRWGIPQSALFVDTFSFDHQAGMMTIPMTATQQILDDRFTAQADAGGIQDPTMMVVREETLRILSIEQADYVTPFGSNGLALSLDPAGVPEMVVAGMSWGPFQYQGAGVWASYPVEEYLNDKLADLETALDPFWDDADDVTGARLLAQSYYLTMHAGIDKIIEVAGTPANLASQLTDAGLHDYVLGPGQVVQIGYAVNSLAANFTGFMNFIQTSFASFATAALNPLVLLDLQFTGNITVNGSSSLAMRNYNGGPTGDTQTISDGYLQRELRKAPRTWRPSQIKDALNRNASSGVHSLDSTGPTTPGSLRTKLAKVLRQGGALSQAAAIIGTLATVGQLIATATGDINTIEVALVFASIQAAVSFVGVITAAASISATFGAAGASASRIAQSYVRGLGANVYGFLFALLISASVAIGFFITQVATQHLAVGSLPFNLAFSGLVASLVVAVIFIALGSVPVLGQIVTAIIGLIDSVINVICLATGATQGTAGTFVQNYICPGISGLLTKAVQFLIYDQTPVVDLSNPNRLNLTNFQMPLSDPASGVTAGNAINVTMDVQTALYVDPFDFTDVSLFLPYRYQFDDEYLLQSTFTYEMLRSQSAITEGIGLSQMTGEWQPPAADSWAPDSNFVVSKTVTSQPIVLDTAGINQPLPDTFLAEGYAINVQECFTIPPVFPVVVPVPVCYLREDIANNHINLGQGLAFDVLPATVDGFMDLVARPDGGYTLQWWTNVAAPTQVDADGDGLRSAAFGGNDPNDSLPDTDFDTLSDFYEIANGTDPLRADADGDTLNDAAELRYGTDPYRADTDGDGLNDAEEIAGWAFVYDYAGAGSPLTTWVWSDPLLANRDGDSFPDSQEKQYGFNPGVASSGAVLTLNSEILDANSAYRPGDDIHYQVTLKNELDLPYLFGLLDVDLPVAMQGDIPPQTFALAPQDSVTSTDQITIDPAITASQVVSLTNRAGALAIDLDAEIAGRTLWMHLNENTGSSVFVDSSLNGHDGSCAGASCPDLGYLGYQGLAPGFLGSHLIDIDGAAQDLGFVNDSYTIQAWVYSIGATGYRTILGTQDGSAGFSVGLLDGHPSFGMDPSLQSGATLTPFRWQRVTWRFDRDTLNYAIFVDGQQVLDQTGFNFGYGALENDGLRIGASGTTDYFVGQVDELSVFPFALSDDAIRDSIGNHSALVFYNGFEVSPLPEWTPIVDDSEYRNNIEVAIADSHPSDYYYLAPLTGVDGFVGDAYLFGSGDQYSDVLEVASSPNLDLSRGAGAFTISTWLNKLPDEGGWIMGNFDLTSSGAGESGYPELWVGANTVTVQFGLSPNVCTLTSSGDGVLNAEDAYVTWHHVAATFNGATLTIYLDNTPIGSQNCAGKKPSDVDTFFIGGRDNSRDGQGFQGSLDELRIYTYALDKDKIADLYWDTAPVTELRFDDAPARTTFNDHALVPHPGTCSGSTCPVGGVQGRINQAILLDGADDAVALADTATLGLSGRSFTVSAWVNLDSLDGEPVLGTIGADPAQLLMLGVESNLPYILMDGTTQWGSSPVSAGTWNHLVWRNLFEPSTGLSHLGIFLNGSQVLSETLPLQLEGSVPAYVGRYNGLYLDGMVDHFQIYRQALSDAEIAALELQAPLINLHFNDPADSLAFVNSAGSPHGVCASSACPVAGTKGQVGTAVHFDGVDDLVSMAHVSAFDTASFSAGMWVRPERRPHNQTMFYTDPAGGVRYYLEIPANSLDVYAQTRGADCAYTPAREMTGATPMIENAWNHIMLTYADGEQRLYINGSLSASQQVSGGICQSAGIIRIGSRAGTPFAGDMDELIYYGSELTPAEIADLVAYQDNWYDTSYDHKITIDTDLPTVAISTTAPFLPDHDLVLAINAFDETSGVQNVEYKVDAGSWLPATRDVDAWLFTFSPSGNGAYTVQTRATDRAGNVTTHSQVLNVDGTPPVIFNTFGSLPHPVTHETGTNTWNLHLAGAVLPADFDYVPTSLPERVFVSLTDQDGLPVSGQFSTVPTPSGSFPYIWELDYPFDVRPNGVYTARVTAVDGVGNAAVAELPISVDGTPPIADIRFTGPSTTTINTSTVLTGTVTDQGVASEISSVEVSFLPADANDRSAVRALALGDILHLPLDDNPAPVTRHAESANEMVHFVDLSGSGTPAVCSGTGCPATAERGRLGNAILFDGVDDNLTVFDVSLNLTGNAYSFGAWVKPEAGSGDDALLAFGADGVLPSSLLLYRQSTSQFVYWDSASGDHASGAVTPDQWHHVWVTIGADNSATLYIDGGVEATFSTGARPATGDDLLLGSAWDGSTNRTFAGLLDDVAVYNHQLNAAEVKRLYRGFEPVLLLPLDEDVLADGDPVQDLSGYDNRVTFTQLADPTKVQYALPGAVGAGAQDMNTAYLAVEPRPYFDLSDGEFTQTAWVYPQTQPPTSANPIIGGVYDPATDFALTYPSLFITNTTRLLSIMGDGTDYYHHVSGNLLTPDAWNFVATTFDGTDYRFYINGVMMESTNAFAGVTPVAATEFDIGHFQWNGFPTNTSHLFGNLDEVAIYRQTLSDQEIAALYRQGWKRTSLTTPTHSPANTAQWSYDVPDELDGSYQIQLRSTDLLGNRSTGSQGNERWAGHIGPEEIPTAVTLAEFAATAYGNVVTVTWQTVSELDNTGFNLYRSQSPAAPDALLAYVPSQGPGSTQGFEYVYRDDSVAPGETYWYWLEDVDVNGVTTMHGPVSVTVTIPTAVTLTSLEAAARPARGPGVWLALALLAGVAWLQRRHRRTM